MDFKLSKEQEMMRKLFREFAETRRRCSPRTPSRRWRSWA